MEHEFIRTNLSFLRNTLEERVKDIGITLKANTRDPCGTGAILLLGCKNVSVSLEKFCQSFVSCYNGEKLGKSYMVSIVLFKRTHVKFNVNTLPNHFRSFYLII